MAVHVPGERHGCDGTEQLEQQLPLLIVLTEHDNETDAYRSCRHAIEKLCVRLERLQTELLLGRHTANIQMLEHGGIKHLDDTTHGIICSRVISQQLHHRCQRFNDGLAQHVALELIDLHRKTRGQGRVADEEETQESER